MCTLSCFVYLKSALCSLLCVSDNVGTHAHHAMQTTKRIKTEMVVDNHDNDHSDPTAGRVENNHQYGV